jgi:hypothetical protein
VKARGCLVAEIESNTIGAVISIASLEGDWEVEAILEIFRRYNTAGTPTSKDQSASLLASGKTE